MKAVGITYSNFSRTICKNYSEGYLEGYYQFPSLVI